MLENFFGRVYNYQNDGVAKYDPETGTYIVQHGGGSCCHDSREYYELKKELETKASKEELSITVKTLTDSMSSFVSVSVLNDFETALIERIISLEDDSEETEKKLEDLKTIVDKLKIAFDKARIDIDKKAEKSEVDASIVDLNKKTDALKVEVAKKSNQDVVDVISSEMDSKASKEDVSELEESILNIMIKLDDKINRGELNSTYDRLALQVGRKAESLDVNEMENRLSTLVNTLSIKVGEMTSSVEKVKEDNTETLGKINETTTKMSKLETLVGSLNTKVDDLNDDFETQSGDISKNSIEIDVVKSSISNLDSKLSNKIEVESNKLDTKISGVETTLTSKIKTGDQTINTRIDGFEDEINEKISDLDSKVVSQKTELSKAITSLDNKFTEDIKQANAAISVVDQKVDALTTNTKLNIETAKAELNTLIDVNKENIEDNEKIIEVVDKKVDNVDIKVDSVGLRITNTKNDLLKTIGDNTTLINDNKTEIALVDKKADDIDIKVDGVEVKVDNIIAEVSENLEILDNSISIVDQKVDNVDIKVDNISLKVDNAKLELEGLIGKNTTKLTDVEGNLAEVRENMATPENINTSVQAASKILGTLIDAKADAAVMFKRFENTADKRMLDFKADKNHSHTDEVSQGTLNEANNVFSPKIEQNRTAIEALKIHNHDDEYLKLVDREGIISEAKTEILGGAVPEVLDTIKEISDALNNDADFSTTISNQIGTLTSDLNTASTKIDATNVKINTEISTKIDTLKSDLETTNTKIEDTKVVLANVEEDIVFDSTSKDINIDNSDYAFTEDFSYYADFDSDSNIIKFKKLTFERIFDVDSPELMYDYSLIWVPDSFNYIPQVGDVITILESQAVVVKLTKVKDVDGDPDTSLETTPYRIEGIVLENDVESGSLTEHFMSLKNRFYPISLAKGNHVTYTQTVKNIKTPINDNDAINKIYANENFAKKTEISKPYGYDEIGFSKPIIINPEKSIYNVKVVIGSNTNLIFETKPQNNDSGMIIIENEDEAQDKNVNIDLSNKFFGFKTTSGSNSLYINSNGTKVIKWFFDGDDVYLEDNGPKYVKISSSK